MKHNIVFNDPFVHFLFAHPQFFHIDKVELEFILEHHDSTISLLIVGN